MQPPPPERGGHILPERLPFLWKRLGFRQRMVLRTVFRNRYRSLVTVASSAIATALIVSSLATADAVDLMMEHEFERTSHEDSRVSLRTVVDQGARRELALLPGVDMVEAHLGVVCDLSSGSLEKRVAVTGLPPEGRLFTPLDRNGRAVRVPHAGLVLSAKLAELLQVRVGESLFFRPLIGRRIRTQTAVVAIVDTYLGLSAYADRRYLARLIGEEDVTNSLLMTTANKTLERPLAEALVSSPAVLGLSHRRRAIDQLEETFGETMDVALGVLVLFAGMIAFGSVLNAALVSLSERKREVGTLRVLGHSVASVFTVFASESALLCFSGVLIGLGLGHIMTVLMSEAYSTELYRFPSIVLSERLLQSVLLMTLFLGLAQLLVLRMLRKLPWRDVINVRE